MSQVKFESYDNYGLTIFNNEQIGNPCRLVIEKRNSCNANMGELISLEIDSFNDAEILGKRILCVINDFKKTKNQQ